MAISGHFCDVTLWPVYEFVVSPFGEDCNIDEGSTWCRVIRFYKYLMKTVLICLSFLFAISSIWIRLWIFHGAYSNVLQSLNACRLDSLNMKLQWRANNSFYCWLIHYIRPKKFVLPCSRRERMAMRETAPNGIIASYSNPGGDNVIFVSFELFSNISFPLIIYIFEAF